MKNICSVNSCDNFVHGRGYCLKHYKKFKKYGDPLASKLIIPSKGFTNKAGYRIICFDGKPYYEHRFLIENKICRPIKKDEVVHHINGKRDDNRLENLELLLVEKHISHHHLKYPIINGKKQCSKCNNILPVALFSKCYRREYQLYCKSCCKDYSKNKKFSYRSDCKKCQNNYNKKRLTILRK